MQRNIEIFDAQVAFILAKLYDKFPTKIDFRCEELEKATKHKEISFDEHKKYCRDTVLFLADNDFIDVQYKSMNGDTFQNVRLTMKGLKSLKQIPKSIRDEETVGEKISKSVAEGFISTAVGLVNSTVMKLI